MSRRYRPGPRVWVRAPLSCVGCSVPLVLWVALIWALLVAVAWAMAGQAL